MTKLSIPTDITERLQSWAKDNKAEAIMIGACTLFTLLLVIHNAPKPMWNDEAWRAYLISHNLSVSAANRDGSPPISLGVFVITKLFITFTNNDFTQRITSFMALLVLPVVSWRFAKTFFRQKMALVFPPLLLTTGYILSYSIQNKPYIIDVVVALALLTTVKRYLDNKLSLTYLLVVIITSVLFSFAGILLLPFIGLCLLFRRNIKHILIFGAVMACFLAVYYVSFLGWQRTSGVVDWFGAYYLGGNIVADVKKLILDAFSTFGLFPVSGYGAAGMLEYPIYWTTSDTYTSLQIEPLLGSVYLTLFAYGLWRLIRNRKYFLPSVIATTWLGTVCLAALHLWPFGNSRTNLFLMVLEFSVMAYGLTSCVRFNLKNPMTVLVPTAIALVFFPFTTIYQQTVKKPQPVSGEGIGFLMGMQNTATYLAQHSHKSDSITTYDWVTGLPFSYYYSQSSYTQPFKSKTQNLRLDTRYSPIGTFMPSRSKVQWEVVGETGMKDGWTGASIKSQARKLGYQADTVYNYGNVQVIRVEEQR